jgi:hypothetical protein
MNETLAQFFISVCGIIIMILLTAIAYFLQKWISSTDSLTQSVNDLKTAVALLQTNQGNADRACGATHKIIELRLNEHAKRLNEHGEAIADLQASTNSKRRKIPETNNETN